MWGVCQYVRLSVQLGGSLGTQTPGQHLYPHGHGVSVLFIGGEGLCPLWWHRDTRGCPPGSSGQRETAFRLFLLGFFDGLFVCFRKLRCFFRSGFRPKYLDFGVYLCKGGSPKANKSECLDCWSSRSCDEALPRVLYLLERGAQGPQMFTEMLGGRRMKVPIEGDTLCPHSSL